MLRRIVNSYHDAALAITGKAPEPEMLDQPPHSTPPKFEAPGPLYALQQKRIKPLQIKPGSYSSRRVSKDVLQAFYTGTQAGFGAFVGAHATAAITGTANKARNDQNGNTNQNASEFLAIAMAPSLATAATKLVTDVSDAIFIKGFQSTVDAQKQTHQNYKNDSLEDLKKRPQQIQEAVAKIDMRLEYIFAAGLKDGDADTVRIERLLRWRQELILSVPTYPKVVEAWRTESSRLNLIIRLRERIKTYPEEYREPLFSIAIQIAANSIFTGKPKRRLQFTLHGLGGMGKDVFCKEIIEDELGIPVIRIDVPSEKDGGVKSLFGETWSAIDHDFPTSDEELLGPLGLKLIKAGYSNAAVIFNELDVSDKTNIDDLKKLQDPSKIEVDIASLMIKLVWSDQTIINIFNGDSQDAAFNDRSESLLLNKTTRKTRELAALKMYSFEEANYTTEIPGGDTALNKSQQGLLKDKFISMLPVLLDNHETKTLSARMHFARSVTTYIAVGLIENKPKSDEEITKFIVDHYEKMPNQLGEKSTMKPVETKQNNLDEEFVWGA